MKEYQEIVKQINMKCPHCKNELKVDSTAYFNAETYHNSVKAIARCCEKLVIIRPKISFEVLADNSNATEDDWGNKVKRNK